jgi:phage/plasmid-associated DNA primase
MLKMIPGEDILDKQSPCFPSMIYGCAKRDSNTPHLLYKLYRIYEEDGYVDCEKIEKDKYDHLNLSYELSVNYEDPDGLIKKPEVEPLVELNLKIKKNSEIYNKKFNITEMRNVQYEVENLIAQDCEAEYLRKILQILDIKRATNYDDWKSIIIILARINRNYKPLAIEFSMRVPEKWDNSGLDCLNKLWDWALENNDDQQKRTERTLYMWAQEDDKEATERINNMTVHRRLFRMITKNTGMLNDTQLAVLLKMKYGKLFISDNNPASNGQSLRDRVWYEFVFPQHVRNDIDNHSIYKWRIEHQYPDTLDDYISNDECMIKYLNDFISHIDEDIIKKADNKNEIDYFLEVKKNLRNVKNKLGKQMTISTILQRCAKEFRCRGFSKMLDKNGDYTGVLNGVLKLNPDIELIRQYHEIPISRSMSANAVINHFTEDMETLETEYKRLFCGEMDAFIYTMCFLSSTLDGNKKPPIFFIWLGEGSNGKSFLLEMHINTLGLVDNNGYATKLNVSFFTSTGKASGPDSEKMSLKFAKFAYMSETEAGEVLRMARIKEFTSETISGNDKFKLQENFLIHCLYVFCSNNDPTIVGQDHGTWRRLLTYTFKLMFVQNPDPGNKFEWKDNEKFANEYPNSLRWKTAHLGILLKYYRILKTQYGGNLNNVPKPTIDKETATFRNEQDTINRFTFEKLQFTDNPDDKINLGDIVEKYINWYKVKINKEPEGVRELYSKFRRSKLKKYFRNHGRDNWILSRHKYYVYNEQDEPPQDEEKVEEISQENDPLPAPADESETDFSDIIMSDDDLDAISTNVRIASDGEPASDEPAKIKDLRIDAINGKLVVNVDNIDDLDEKVSDASEIDDLDD